MSMQRSHSSRSKSAMNGLVLVLAFAFAGATRADWDESLQGDLSSDPGAPTVVDLEPGSNTISGTVITPADVRDYVTFTVEADESLVAIHQLSYVDLPGGGPGDRGFHAINTGATSFIPSGGTAGGFLGGDHLDPLPPGTDMLPILAGAPLAGTGFTVPLGPGTYTYMVQQTGGELTGYEIEIVLASAVPLLSPMAVGALSVLSLVSGAFLLRGQRQRSQARR